MAKNKKYHFDYVDLSNTTHTVEIYVEGFGGVSTEIIGGATPFTVEKNKDFTEQYLGGIAVTKFTVQALSTATFKASLFTSQVYGDVIIRHKTGATYDYDAILVPYNSMDKDLPDGTYITELYCECGLNNLKNIDYVVADQRSKVSAIIHKCLQNVPYIGAYPYKILDNSLLSTDDAGTVTSKWVDVYINENHFADKSCYDVLSELLINIRELTFSNGSWWIRNISELSNLDSFIWSYDASFASPTSAAYNRTAATINDRLSGGYFGKLFSQKNVVIEKEQSKSSSQFAIGAFTEIANLNSWTKNGLANTVFTLTNQGLYNNGNSIFQTTANTDGTYLQNTTGISFFPFKSTLGLGGEERDGLTVKIKHTDGLQIKNLRFQFIAFQKGLNYTYFLTNEGSWYRQTATNTQTPLYFVKPKYKDTTTIEIPTPPYYDGREFPLPLTDFGYNQTLLDLYPSSNIEYDFFVRIYLPERLSSNAVSVDSYIESIDITVESTEEAFNGFSKDFGVSTIADRQNKLSVSLSALYPVYPHGTETAYTAATGDTFYSYFKEYGGILYKAMDDYMASEYLNVLSRRLKTYDGSVFTQLAFTDLIEIDSVKYRLQNYKLDVRNNTTYIKAIELGYGASVLEQKEVQNLLNQATKDQLRKLIDLQEGRLKTIFPDVNFETKIGNGGETQLVMKPNVQHETALLTGGQVFLKSDTENTVTLDTTDVTNDYTLKAPNLTAEATIATDATAWMLGGNTVGVKKTIGTLDNFDLGIVTNGVERATVKSTGIDVVGRVTAATAAITGLTTNYLPKAGAGGLLVNSKVFDNGTNVGIGTVTPNGLLEIYGIGTPTTMFRIITSGGGGFSFGAKDNSANPTWRFGTNSGESLTFDIGGVTTGLFLNPFGNVAIGTTSPTDKLHVNGTTRTTNLKINNGAAVGKVWQCTNADGTGAWVSPLASERYIGEWDASSGTAPSATPTNGDYYVVSVGGTYLGITYVAGDEIYWDGTAWLRRQNFLTLPIATASVLGGVKIGDRISISSGVISADAQDWSIITGKPTTIEGYGITDAYTKTESDGNYIKNQNASAQSANMWISGTTRTTKLLVNKSTDSGEALQVNGDIYAAGSITTGREGHHGTYSSSWVQGIWSVAKGFKISTVNNDFGNHFGLVYGYTSSGTAAPNGSGKNVLAGWGHQHGIADNGLLRHSFSGTTGNVWHFGGMYLGSSNTTVDDTPIRLNPSGVSFINSGNFGIANTSPSEPLDVSGNIKYTGLLKPTGTAGASNQVLSTNGTNDGWVTLSTSYLSDWSSAWDTKLSSSIGTIAGTVAEGDHGHVIGDITSLSTVLDGKLNTPTLITNAVPYWDGLEFQNSFLRYGSGELSGEGKIILKEPSYSSPVITLENNFFGGTIQFGGVSNAIIPTIDGFATLKLGYSNQKFKEINFSVTNYITLDSPIYEEITFQQEGFTRELRGLRIDEFDVSKIGTDIDTGAFSVMLGSYDDAGNRRSRDWENIINPSDGRWYKIEADGTAKKYLLEGEVSTGGGGTYEIPTLQEVSEQGASSTIRLQFNNVNYATINDVGEALGLDAVLTNSAIANEKSVRYNMNPSDQTYSFHPVNIFRNDIYVGGLSGSHDVNGSKVTLIGKRELDLTSTDGNVIVNAGQNFNIFTDKDNNGSGGLIQLFGRLRIDINSMISASSKADAISQGANINEVFRIGTQLHIVDSL